MQLVSPVHACPQTPQLFGSLLTSTSHPSPASVLQSCMNGSHTMRQAEAKHSEVALAGVGSHALSQLPQCERSKLRSKQLPEQQSSPVSQGWLAVHPGTHSVPVPHSMPSGQSPSDRHPTHRWRTLSQVKTDAS